VLSCSRPAGDKRLASSQPPPEAPHLHVSRISHVAVARSFRSALGPHRWAYGVNVEGEGPYDRSAIATMFCAYHHKIIKNASK
jgi:hypothetical protein